MWLTSCVQANPLQDNFIATSQKTPLLDDAIPVGLTHKEGTPITSITSKGTTTEGIDQDIISSIS